MEISNNIRVALGCGCMYSVGAGVVGDGFVVW